MSKLFEKQNKEAPPQGGAHTHADADIVTHYSEQVNIPRPYFIDNNGLHKNEKKGEIIVSMTISRLAPKLMRELTNVERNSVHYELNWTDRGQDKKEIVPAATLATKSEMIKLSASGFSVNDLNCRSLIDYFDKYLALNELYQSHMVERLGHIKGAFIHPLASQGIEIVPADSGERQLLEAFEVKGTVDSWKENVFELIKHQRKVLFMVFSSFASVILEDLKVEPFLVDLSGNTSQGKTTALQTARSPWGTKHLINEWNTTKVAVERRAGFLNSFPLFMDDTRKADEKLLQSIVYHFSGGRGKGRGTLKGSQQEVTWCNILMSTGEASLVDYGGNKGGVAARIIPLVDEPFDRGYDFAKLYKGIDENYGSVGLEFVKLWNEQKENHLSHFHVVRDFYMKISKGNEVLERLSMYYAAVHFTGFVVNQMFCLGADMNLLINLFNEIASENKALNKPKQLLEQMLVELDGSKTKIHYVHEPVNMRAIFKNGDLWLNTPWVNEYLGVDSRTIREEWRKKGYTHTFVDKRNKKVDYKLIKHCRASYSPILVSSEIISEMGFDFAIEI